MKRITSHFLKVYSALKESPNSWLSVNQVAEKSGINAVTTKHHIRFLYKQKLLERVETFPYVYKVSNLSCSDFSEQLDQTIGKLG
ncbi:hypothetical protein [uncultured Nostoc sp.]|uniref:hypothetical protein n=1 Tax=uncultured Nostoc sp. TaxID=340711 RepID=UPI0035C997CC